MGARLTAADWILLSGQLLDQIVAGIVTGVAGRLLTSLVLVVRAAGSLWHL